MKGMIFAGVELTREVGSKRGTGFRNGFRTGTNMLGKVGLATSYRPGKPRERLPHFSTEVIAHHAHQALGRLGGISSPSQLIEKWAFLWVGFT